MEPRLATVLRSRTVSSLVVDGKWVGVRSALAALLLMSASTHAQQTAPAPDAAMPPLSDPLAPPPSREPIALVQLADYRYDDLLWENDRTAHRIYGHALEAVEPPSGSGIDSWAKHVPWPFADRQLRHGRHHDYHGEGLDFYNVGTGRGAGGLGIWSDNKLWVSRNYIRYRIIQTGGQAADFEVDYAPWPVDTSRKVWETRRFTLPLGTHFTRIVSTIHSDRRAPLVVAVGIGKRTTAAVDGEVLIDRARGLLSWWGPSDPTKGRMMIALRVDPAMIVDARADFDNHLLLLRVKPGKPFVYFSGSAWDKGQGNFRTRDSWESYARETTFDFTVPTKGR